MPEATRRFDWIVTGLALALPVLVYREATTSLVAQDAASGGPMRDAAFFPEVVAWALLLPIAANLVRLARSSRAPVGGPASGDCDAGPDTRQALTAAGSLSRLLGHAAPGRATTSPRAILMMTLMLLFGGGWAVACAATASLTLGVAFVFEGLLNVVLPLGFLKFTLFG